MKRIIIILLGLFSVAYGQFSPSGSKIRYVNGISLGTKLDGYYNAADSNAIYWRADSVLRAKYRGMARTLAFIDNLADSLIWGNITGSLNNQTDLRDTLATRVRLQTGNLFRQDGKVWVSDTIRTAGTLYVGTNISVNDNQFKIGSNGISTATFVGTIPPSLSGIYNSGFGTNAGVSISSGARNTAIGFGSLFNLSTGSDNVALGYGAGAFLSGGSSAGSPNRSVYIGSNVFPGTSSATNEIVIGDTTAGYGSNTMTLGNTNILTTRVRGNTIIGGTITAGGATLTGALSGTSAGFSDSIVSLSGMRANNGVLIGGASSVSTGFIQKAGTSSSITNSVLQENVGKIGLGVVPDVMLHIRGNVTTNGDARFNLNLDDSSALSANIGGGLNFRYRFNGTAYVDGAQIFGYKENSVSGEFGTGIRIATRINGGDPTARLDITPIGNIISLGVYNATVGATNRDLFVDNTGLIGYVSSFRASKKNIAPLDSTSWLHSLNPVKFNYRIKDSIGRYTDSVYNELEYGLIAEEVETVNKEMVFYDVDSIGNKSLRGVHYSKLIVPMLKEIQEQKKTITALESRIAKLEALIGATVRKTRR